MLENMSALAIVPKAKAIGARRLTRSDYLALMRRRSVIEVMAALQNHPYFRDSLSGISQTNLHRAQLEQALRKDVFYKYESLMRYSFRKGHFGSFFLIRCEVQELLAKLRLLALGYHHHYIVQMPGFLASKTSFSLLRLAKAETPAQCLPVLAGTPYAKLLEPLMPAQGENLDYLACEQALYSYYYTRVLAMVRRDLPRAAAADTAGLFRQEAEIYNLDMLYRAKAFYADQLAPARLKSLLLPVYGRLSRRALEALADAPDLTAFLRLYNASRAAAVYGPRSDDLAVASDVAERRVLYRTAERLLHFSSSPQTVLAALLCLAEMERSNIINVIEGVRYGLPAEQIDAFLKY